MWLRRSILYSIRVQLRPSCRSPWLPPSLHYSDVPYKKGKVAPLQERRMVDKFRLWAKGGPGGNGCWSIRRSRSDRHGTPDGGNGGRGGDVILECSAAVWDFSNLQHHLNAKKGRHGVSKNKIGSRGADKVMQVPVGTVIHLVSGEAPSFVESTSVTSSLPWEMQDSAEAIPAISTQNDENMIITPRFVGNKVPYASPSYYTHNAQSSSKHHTVDGYLSSTEVDNLSSLQQEVSCSEVFDMEFKDEGNDKHANTNNTESAAEEEEEEEEESEEEEEEEEVQFSVAELTEPGQRIMVARGGDGGLGNFSLKKDRKLILDSENQSSFSGGVPGSEAVVILELKSIADVGLVGMPNAGKSTLLGAISRAKPVVGHYAFTTLRPNIGNLNYEDYFSVTVADIPGLIKGAHENRGLGHAFLRHIERTKVLAYVVDLAAALEGRKGISPWEQLRDLVLELEYHREGMSDRPSLVVANKIDEEGADNVYKELTRRVQGVPIFPVCAVLEEGIPELKVGLRKLMTGDATQRVDLDSIIVD